MTYDEMLVSQLAFCERELEELAYDERPTAHERREVLLDEIMLLKKLLRVPEDQEDSA